MYLARSKNAKTRKYKLNDASSNAMKWIEIDEGMSEEIKCMHELIEDLKD